MPEYIAKYRLTKKPLGSMLGSRNPRMTLMQVSKEELEGEPFKAVDDTAAVEFAAIQARFLIAIHQCNMVEVLEIRCGDRVIKVN